MSVELTKMAQSLTSKDVSRSTKASVIRGLWNIDIHRVDLVQDGPQGPLDSYFTYYLDQAAALLRDDGLYVSVRTHRDVTQIAEALMRTQMGKEELLGNLQRGSETEPLRIENSVNLTARLIFMMSIGKAPYVIYGGTNLGWTNESGTIKDCVSDFITNRINSSARLGGAGVKLDKIFTAQNLGRIAGLKITWTDDISDHLRLFNLDTEVAIFHHASLLRVAQQACIFPYGFAEETLETLALLLPKGNNSSGKWYRGLASRRSLDHRAHSCPPLQTEHRQMERFHYWHDRLVVLKMAFDESEPLTWRQWWYDTRKGLYRWPFLVATAALVLTAFFGLVQSIQGGLQVYKAYFPS